MELFEPGSGTAALERCAARAFGDGPDADVSEWFSFEEMEACISSGRGSCVQVAMDGGIQGFVYAQQENPINGKEGTEKWMIVIVAVDPDFAGTGIGSTLLRKAELLAAVRGAIKMFVYTNQHDDGVLEFYRKNGYADAGWVRDYQHGEANSAAFLLKYLGG